MTMTTPDDNNVFSSIRYDDFERRLRKILYVSLVVCVFFKEIWLKLNYAKIFRQNFYILYTCTHILPMTRQYQSAHSHSIIEVFCNVCVASILYLISFNNNNKKWRKIAIETHAKYLYIKIERAQKKQIDQQNKSMHVFFR